MVIRRRSSRIRQPHPHIQGNELVLPKSSYESMLQDEADELRLQTESNLRKLCSSLLKLVDKDGDGVINYEEFTKLILGNGQVGHETALGC